MPWACQCGMIGAAIKIDASRGEEGGAGRSHCEERSDELIEKFFFGIGSLDCFAAFAMTTW